ncbi:MAG: DNA mismatch repair endonuclease MutL [Acholeplasmatales bacterium]|jgi:DNA mismatch repair protein MutL|nr:DNA mismatch repair endonuclease MutL [Acholeplasmatales bacterium]
MSIINVMSDELSNVIAAGEVVEHLSSVVKELIENSIDARASSITIKILNSGKKLIEVIDDGCGMVEEDIKKSILRNATSKISNRIDLNHLKTLGFRGEALASISSVSRFSILSKTIDSDAFFYQTEGNKEKEFRASSGNPGTTIRVEDIFFNTPARFKFLSNDKLEERNIIEIFYAFALTNPHIRFKLYIDDKLFKETFGTNKVLDTFISLFGEKISSNLLYFETLNKNVKINGYLVSPFITKSNKRDIYLTVNNRLIKNPRLINAVVDGFHSFIMLNRFPIALINIEVDTTSIDPNVHPQKLFIKIANEYQVAYQIEKIVKDTLVSKTISPLDNKINNNFHNTYQNDSSRLFNNDFKGDSLSTNPIYDSPKEMLSLFENNDSLEEIDLLTNSDEKLPYFDYVGTLFQTYLLFQNENGMYLIDTHAAAERIRYEYYYNSFSRFHSGTTNLLVEYSINYLRDDEINLLNSKKDILANLGIGINGKLINSIPNFLRDKDIDSFLEIILSYLIDDKEIDLSRIFDNLAKSVSCKGAVKANHQLSIFEINTLISDLRKCDNPYTCPHGRPVMILISDKEIEKLFKRIV